ncbi:MAG TPA: hypothetical protein VHR66_11425 [Gemmataceae bacterium]|jgi:hypothetical protein|nr:hypothetical protein [Gemmataceae bacterium]
MNLAELQLPPKIRAKRHSAVPNVKSDLQETTASKHKWNQILKVAFALPMPYDELVQLTREPDYLLRARFVPPAYIRLQFADGNEYKLSVRRLGIPFRKIKWLDAETAPNGGGLALTAVKGEAILIPSTTLRYLVDSDYAASVDKKFEEDLAFANELDDEGETPAGMFDSPPRDLVMESWK